MIRTLRKDSRGVSPAISTVILTGAVVVMLLVAITFADNYLSAGIAENEFSAMKQFMQTLSLQADDVAWTAGRTQTVRYASKFGHVDFESSALTYTIFVNNNVFIANFTTGILLFNMPVNRYSMGNNYFQRIFPSGDGSFIHNGTAAPVCNVFDIQRVPMSDGSYIRIVAAPSIRMLNSTISSSGQQKNYFKFYLPLFVNGTNPRLSQSVTLSGQTVNARTIESVNSVKIVVTYPKSASSGYGSDFFNFSGSQQVIVVPTGSIMEFYTSGVTVSLGLTV